MAIVSKAISVNSSTVPVLVYDPGTSGATGDNASSIIRFTDSSSSATVYLGAGAVSSSTGYPLKATGEFSLKLFAGEQLYAVVDTPTVELRVLSTGA